MKSINLLILLSIVLRNFIITCYQIVLVVFYGSVWLTACVDNQHLIHYSITAACRLIAAVMEFLVCAPSLLYRLCIEC